MDTQVNIWQEEVIIPTYGVGKPDKNPMFFEKRVYQGSSGVVYPNAVIEKVADEKKEKRYIGLFLENRYIKVLILPELGGRIQMAYDKIGQRHFVYYNQVIKPALVGLTGPWISGGIEFNWPQHHRPSTFEPIDFDLEEHADGSKTVWVNELEKMFHTKGMAGFTLYPDKAYIEIKAKLYNRSPLPQTFLWWANPAVKVNDHYQSVFPPDVNAVFDHGKRDVSTFPIATGTYYKVDYAPGTDISRYKNIPVPTSYMAIRSDYDFVGGYEHDSQAGLLHVANHHVSPGKKQWTWGNGDFGQAWDRNLTDEDGPYIELMTGVYTDNQPDFSWLMPYEEKSFTQYFMPYRALGMIKNASKDILLAIDPAEKGWLLKVAVTGPQPHLDVRISSNEKQIFADTIALDPESSYERLVPTANKPDERDLIVAVADGNGRELLRYEPAKNKANEIPEPAKPARAPADVESTEQLFLTGQHLEQYRHATYSPIPYYEEALRRDPTDIRNNNALGVWYLRRGQFNKSELFFRQAIETATQRNPNPYDSEPYYNLGLSLRYQDDIDGAYEAFFKATWNNAWKDAGYFSVAQIDMLRGRIQSALEHVGLALQRNAAHGKAYVLQSAAYRKLGNPEAALIVCETALRSDRFNLGVLYESVLANRALGNDQQAAIQEQQLANRARGTSNNLIAYAVDYSLAGLYKEALSLLDRVSEPEHTPMVFYYQAWIHQQLGNQAKANALLEQAANANPYLCFPNRLDDIRVLRFAMDQNKSDSRAPYYLGNLFYDKRQYDEAISLWEKAAKAADALPTVFRNLGIAYFNKRADAVGALACYEKAFAMDPSDARVLMELDQLYKLLNRQPADRLVFLEARLGTVLKRDDVYLEWVSLYNTLGQEEKALELLLQRKFHPWEGGEGKASGQYVYSKIALAKKALHSGNAAAAIDYLRAAQVYPQSLGEGKLHGAQENDIFFWLGRALTQLGDPDAIHAFRQATIGLDQPAAAIFYNDQQPDKIFYQGLAWLQLGEIDRATGIFEKLLHYGEAHLHDEVSIDYFAVSLPDLLIFDVDLYMRNQTHCYFMQALGHLGLAQYKQAKEALEKVLQRDASHQGAITHLSLLKSGLIRHVALPT